MQFLSLIRYRLFLEENCLFLEAMSQKGIKQVKPRILLKERETKLKMIMVVTMTTTIKSPLMLMKTATFFLSMKTTDTNLETSL
jgi:hypothetical protein